MNNLVETTEKLKIKRIILAFIPFILIIIYLFVKENLNEIVNSLPKCFILSNFGIYCPGCGNTRCIAALINLDILSAVRYNPFMFGVIFCAVLCYIERFADVFFRKNVLLIPRKPVFWVIVTVLLVIFYVLRMFFEFLR